MQRLPKAVYTKEFREQAVKWVLAEGLSVPEAGQRLSLSPKTLANGVRAARGGGAQSRAFNDRRQGSAWSGAMNEFEAATILTTTDPQAKVRLCIVHLVRNSLRYVSYKDRKGVAAALKPIYRAVSVTEAERALGTFAEGWDTKYPSISALWHRHWAHIITIFDYPDDIQWVIYTTHGIESLNRV
ncbi:MAG: transposase [Gammaproteobacteria bacterium]